MEADRPKVPAPFFEVQQEVRRLFDEMVRQPWGSKMASDVVNWQPRCDIVETDEAIVVEVELPGVVREDVHVEVEGDLLRLAGERRTSVERQERHYRQVERQYGRFERQLQLPSSVDREAIEAIFQDGILIITLPKKSQP